MGPEMATNARIGTGPTPGAGGSARRFVIRNLRVPTPGGTTGTPRKINCFDDAVLNPVKTLPEGITPEVPFTWPTNGNPFEVFNVGAGIGSSINVRASVSSGPGPVRLLVMFVFRKIDMFTGAAIVGFPPVQVSTISLTSSVLPSARTTGGTGALALQVRGGGA